MKQMTTIKASVAIDTNIILYCFDEDLNAAKKLIALDILSCFPSFSSQVLSEVINICHKRWKYNKSRLIKVANFLIENCTLHPIDHETITLAHSLILKYDFRYFDALIIASAITSNCNILYSEDMQHNMLVENKLTIINPFL
jgi:predicted nucleic acid-binding protein